MKFRFPGKKKQLQKAKAKGSRPFAVRLTPYGTTKHIKVATLDAEMYAMSIPNSTQAFILVEREALDARIPADDDSYVAINEEVIERAINMIDNEIAGNRNLIKRWTQRVAQGFSRSRAVFRVLRTNPTTSRESALERENQKLEKEISRLKAQENKEAGTAIELMIAGLIPFGEAPPIPLRNIQQMHYGCDWLCTAWSGDTLHLFWIESNLSRTQNRPSLTKNERRFMEVIKGGQVVNHHVHHWIDADGDHHWE